MLEKLRQWNLSIHVLNLTAQLHLSYNTMVPYLLQQIKTQENKDLWNFKKVGVKL